MTAFCDTVTGYISNDAEFVGLLAGHNSPRLKTNSQFVRSNSVTHDRRTGTELTVGIRVATYLARQLVVVVVTTRQAGRPGHAAQ